TNLRLSKERARSVWQWLKDSDPSGVNINDRRQEGIEGYGSYRPLPNKQNRTHAERAAHRGGVTIFKEKKKAHKFGEEGSTQKPQKESQKSQTREYLRLLCSAL